MKIKPLGSYVTIPTCKTRTTRYFNATRVREMENWQIPPMHQTRKEPPGSSISARENSRLTKKGRKTEKQLYDSIGGREIRDCNTFHVLDKVRRTASVGAY